MFTVKVIYHFAVKALNFTGCRILLDNYKIECAKISAWVGIHYLDHRDLGIHNEPTMLRGRALKPWKQSKNKPKELAKVCIIAENFMTGFRSYTPIAMTCFWLAFVWRFLINWIRQGHYLLLRQHQGDRPSHLAWKISLMTY